MLIWQRLPKRRRMSCDRHSSAQLHYLLTCNPLCTAPHCVMRQVHKGSVLHLGAEYKEADMVSAGKASAMMPPHHTHAASRSRTSTVWPLQRPSRPRCRRIWIWMMLVWVWRQASTDEKTGPIRFPRKTRGGNHILQNSDPSWAVAVPQKTRQARPRTVLACKNGRQSGCGLVIHWCSLLCLSFCKNPIH